ncbi:spermidine synthase isoform X2 [Planococcus citri]
MDALKKGWFSEVSDMWPGICLSFEVEKVIHSEKSKYQDIMMIETKNHGRALILDGIIQCTEFDEFSYQEIISFLPLCSHPCPKKVLIVGGGDGGVAREVSKHPAVEEIDQVEIDERVVEVSKQFLPSMACGYNDPKVNLIIDDGIKFMEANKNKYDVIITDSSDPVGPADCLFQRKYFELMKEALRPGGIVCSQAGSVWCNLDTSTKSYEHCKNVFAKSAYAYACVPTYPSGQIGFVLGSTNPETDFPKPAYILSEELLEKKNIRYYSPAVHTAAFALPRSYQKYFV